MPDKIFAYINITRPVNLVLTFITVIISGFLIHSDNTNFGNLCLAAFSAAIAAAAGNVINDIRDIKIDRINRPERPLPSGKISRSQAYAYYIILNLSSAAISVFISLPAFAIVIASQIIIFSYSYKLKSVPLAGNIAVAFLTGLTVVFGVISGGGKVVFSLIPAAFAFLINFIREIVKDIEDIEGDAVNGVVTAASKFGTRKSKIIISALTVLLFLFTFLPYIYELYKIEYFIVVMCIVNPMLVLFLKKLYAGMVKADYSHMSALLKIIMLAGLAAVYMGNI